MAFSRGVMEVCFSFVLREGRTYYNRPPSRLVHLVPLWTFDPWLSPLWDHERRTTTA